MTAVSGRVRLPEPVLVRLRREPEREFARGTKPACWRADVVGGMPEKFDGASCESVTREGAVRGTWRRRSRSFARGEPRACGRSPGD